MKGIGGGSAGLAFSSALMLTGMTQWGVRQSAELESQMTSVERIIEYSKLEQEADLDSTEDKKPDKDWPKNGEIKMVNMSIFYDNAPKPVLKNICCSIRGGEKIGICSKLTLQTVCMTQTYHRYRWKNWRRKEFSFSGSLQND